MEKKNLAAVAVGAVTAAAAAAAALVLLRLRRREDEGSAAVVLQRELIESVQVGKDGGVTLQDLPYYLSEQARAALTNAAYVHLKRAQFSRFASQLAAASQAILLSGPEGTEAYHQRIAKALANHFDTKLLLLDVPDLVSKTKVAALTRRRKSPASLARGAVRRRSLAGLWVAAATSSSADAPRHSSLSDACSADDVAATTSGAPPPPPSSRGAKRAVAFDEIFVDTLFTVLRALAEADPVVVYLRDVENFVLRSPKMYALFVARMKKLRGPILILGSRIGPPSSDAKPERTHDAHKLEALFRYKVSVKPPEDAPRLVSWKSQVEEDAKAIQAQDNRNRVIEVLYSNNLECDDILSVGFSDTGILSSCIEEVVVSALSHHLMNMEDPEYRAGRLLISAKSLTHGLSLFQAGRPDGNGMLQGELKVEPSKDLQETTPAGKPEPNGEPTPAPTSEIKAEIAKVDVSKSEPAKKADLGDASNPAATPAAAGPVKPADTAPDNEFEKRIRPEVIPAGEIGVNFQDIGALESVKEALHELVMLPLRRPELFSKGGLIKRCKGILLFGPPGTGKTMLAKAVATEAGASFINVSMSAITSKWFGEDEKNVRALFTLAAKVSPTVIFIDEVDSMLGQRSRVGEHEAMRKIKNEFMAHWDGLLTKGGERVLVLAATNRPFDLDEAIIRRFERRIMVGLPDESNREKILRAILSKEELEEGFDFKELAAITEGYSGSDLKNLCVAGAYRPIRELLSKERKEDMRKKTAPQEKRSEDSSKAVPPTAEAEAEKDNSAADADAAVDDAAIAAAAVDAAAVDDATIDAAVVDAAAAPAAATASSEEDSQERAVGLLRPLSIQDIREAKTQVSASFAVDGSGMQELRDWNNLYGEGGSRKKQQLTYFL